MHKHLILILWVVMTLVLYIPAAHAATFTVSNLNDSGAGSLRQAVLDANAGASTDTITFTVSGTITLTSGQLLLTNPVTINASTQTVTISGNNASRIFQINTGVTVEIRDLTLTNGNPAAQGGAIVNSGTLTINDSTFTGNQGSAGGAIFSDGSLTINRTTLSNNTTTNVNTGGGAIYNNSGTLIINDSTLSGNQTAADGGAIVGGGTMTITNSTIANNTAARLGGGIVSITGILTVTGSTISGNTATSSNSGGIYSSAGLNMTNSTISGNQAATDGGGLFSANATINNSTITDNTAANGGNIYVTLNTATISRSIIDNGTCATAGGATLADGGNNVQFDAAGCVGTNGDPQLQPLADNGGLTETHALGATSAALDQYTIGCPATDQRGITRPQGAACDIGAFEIITFTSITENEFFAAVEAARSAYPDISRIVVDFVPNTMNLTVATSAAGIGNVSVTLAQQDGFVTFNISSITVNGSPAPANYTTIINRDLPNILVQALDSILTERFGSGFDVQTMTLTNTALVVDIGS